ncbi:MAG TPA: AAA family ATPase, partial [Herpetosiphonaceae bacterium]
MNPLLPYLAHDRRQALASGIELPPLSHGALLFADISGWTALTARLTQELGARRGIDELIERLNRAYEEIIAAVERYGGSVVSFAGDSLTCWFAADAGPRAAASSLAIQASLEAGADPTAPELALTMRAAIAAGELVRFSVGDPALHCLDVVAGSALNRLRRIERLARPREVLIDAATSAGLGDTGLIGERRGRGAVVLRGLRRQPPDQPWPDLAPDATSPALLRPWVFPAVRDRLLHGAGDFLTELRPAAALFARLPALDFRADPGQRHALDRSVRWAQQVVARHDGTLLDVSVDAKGSVIHAAFGAPVAHEDDALRAAAAARELGDAEQGIPGLQIGLALGVVRAGAYGGATRRTYGVLGDAVNVAARLMEQAGPGEILANAALAEATSQDCAWRELPPRSLKGKDQPVTPFRLDGLRAARGGLREPRTAGPIEGRAGELAWLQAGLERASAGRGQFLGVTAEAGMGKSRLLLELMGQARGAGWRVCAGACQSSGTATPYLVWQSLARDLFELDPEQPAESQAAALAAALAALDPALLPRLPLLGVALNLPLPDNELTAGMDARLRKESLAALLVACLRLGARRERLLLVLEDCHWMDPLSHDLLERVSRAIAREPVAIVAAYRSFEAAWLQSERISALPHFAEVRLGGLEPAAAARLVERRAGQMGLELAPALVGELVARADGTPFYLEELLHYVNENKIDSAGELAGEALPPSLHSLVLSRVDLLNDQQKLTVKLASVIGRVFPAPWLWGYYPAL